MRLYLVRRTRSFIQDNYAQTDPATGRKFLTFEDGTRSYFPVASPRRSSSRSTRRTPTTSTPAVRARRGRRHQRPDPAALRPGQLHQPPRRTSRRRQDEAKVIARPVPRRQAAHGLLPHQPLQAPGKQRPRLHPVRRAAHPAQLHLPARHRERPAIAHRHPGLGLLDACVSTTTTTPSCIARGRRRQRQRRSRPANPACCEPRTISSDGPPRSTTSTPGSYKRRFKWLRPDLFVPDSGQGPAERRRSPAEGAQARAATGTRPRTPSCRPCSTC